MLVGAATVFAVQDVLSSVAYYRDALGFAVTFEYGEPLSYACLCRDEVQIHLISVHQTRRIPGNGEIAVFVANVDDLYAELLARGAKAPNPPQDRDYGMRNFEVVDLDGNQLVFGMEINGL